MSIRRWSAVGLALSAVAAVLLSGCTEVKQALNKGGDTPCSEYVKQDQDTQRMTVTKFVQQQSGDTQHQPAGTTVDMTMAAVGLLCSTQRDPQTPIKNADVAGIFFNK
ncbi:hypothetical protein [Nocardia stercoris]|uniref:Acid stress chaperone HdeA n=1 Tax=Nocardia stercoris TaxID=2483361 RepID=A0A3M2L7K3_9NOCA|nr:hypothetical protein [Nocardia stercoris]RMI33334.1 hypothetical protein EBN03_09190 [Nocardia stercoris]